MRPIVTALLSTLLLAGCADPADPEPASTVRISASAWAGGTFGIHGLSVAQASLRVYADSIDLGVGTQSADSVIVSVPDSLAGVRQIRLGTPASAAIGSIRLAGVERVTRHPVIFTAEPFVLNTGSVAAVIATTGATAPPWVTDIVRFEPGSNVVTKMFEGPYDWSRTGVRMPVLTRDPNVIGFKRLAVGDTVDFWRVTGAPELVGKLGGLNVARQFAVYGDSSYLRTTAHNTFTFTAGGVPVQSFFNGEYEDATTIVLSPDRMRALLPVSGSRTGVPMFGRDGRLLYNITTIRSSESGVFSRGGDTLIIAGTIGSNTLATPDGRRVYLLVLDAASGTELRRLDIEPAYEPWELAFDPGGRWLYITAETTTFTPTGTGGNTLTRKPFLFVLDARTLTVLSIMKLPGCGPSCGQQIVTGTDGVFLVSQTETIRVSRPD
jgi:hypothetical protein